MLLCATFPQSRASVRSGLSPAPGWSFLHSAFSGDREGASSSVSPAPAGPPLRRTERGRVFVPGSVECGPQEAVWTRRLVGRTGLSLALIRPLSPAGLDHRSRRLCCLLLRGGVCLPSELLHERHQPRHRADAGECGPPAIGAAGPCLGLPQAGAPTPSRLGPFLHKKKKKRLRIVFYNGIGITMCTTISDPKVHVFLPVLKEARTGSWTPKGFSDNGHCA